MIDQKEILSMIDLEIKAAGAREMPIDTILLAESDFQKFCIATGHKDSVLKDWPLYKGIRIIKQRKNKQ
jgi:hypothetical protein